MATTRRTFLAAAGAATAATGAFQETLAMNGGPKAVTYAPARASALSKWPRYGAAEKQALHDLIDSGRFYEELPAFEKEWQHYTKAPFVKAHMNGTSAITSMYFALDLPPGSEVMVPSYTFFSPCLALRFFGLVPIFIDIDPKTATFDLEDAKRKLTPRTKAVEVMHSWGMPCQMDAIGAWAKEKGLILIEDAAHAHGASFHGRKMGTFGEMAIYSYQTSKVMPAIEGGMGMYRSREYFERASAFGHYEDPVKFAADSPVRAYEGTGFGQKYRMHPMAAAIARIQLRSLDERNGVARKNVAALNGRVAQLAAVAEPKLPGGAERVYYNGNMLLIGFAKLGVSRDTIIKALKAEGVQASFWDYPEQHKLKIYSEAKWWHHAPKIPEKMPGTAWINANHIFVPCQYGEAPDLIEQYAKAFEKVWAHRKQLAGA
ncbi:MAG: TetR family transcriptional regulator [Candidatus Solibacter sp.]|nr:TetR family transcriptional regulator [Candidatus Solibacter sp.]